MIGSEALLKQDNQSMMDETWRKFGGTGQLWECKAVIL